MAESEGAERTEEATPHKLQQARQKGDVVKTADLPTLASFAAVISVIAMGGGYFAKKMAAALTPFIAHADDLRMEGHGGVQILRMAMGAGAPMLLTVMGCAAVAGAAGNIVQHGLMFTPDKIKPDLKKLSPLAGLKRIFGLDNGVQFAKSVVKIGVVGWIAWGVVAPHVPELQRLAAIDPTAIMPLCAAILRKLVFAVAGLLLVMAGADYMWQRHRFMQRMKMTKEEIKEEFKQQDGDPHVKAKRRQIQMQRSRRRMLQAVPQATVVVMNPTHYAVALKYEEGAASAPECVAKGLDALALKIRAVAEEAGVTVIEDPPLARALYAAVDVDEQIPPAHYEAVAKIIGFIMQQAQRRGSAAKPAHA